MKKRQAAQRQAEIVERTTNKQQTAEAWEAAQAERDAVQAAYVEKVELDCNVISMRCEQSMPREYAHQVSVKLTSIQHTIAQTPSSARCTSPGWRWRRRWGSSATIT